MPSLIYIADPMCSWCYGFGPELEQLREALPGLPVHVVVGGLRPYQTQPMEPAKKNDVRAQWNKVAERTGLPFVDSVFSRADFIYDTEPASRAVVTTRLLAPAQTLTMLHAVQRAFYAEGKDVTRGDVLAEIGARVLAAKDMEIDAAAFLSLWSSEKAINATRDDFLQTQHWGVSGFPTLVLEREGQLDLVNAGYITMPELVALMQAILDRESAVG